MIRTEPTHYISYTPVHKQIITYLIGKLLHSVNRLHIWEQFKQLKYK
jgi:hypothetical protein